MKMKKSLEQNVKFVAIVGLLTITPLVSSTYASHSSSKYLIIYFILNILIIAVGADAGLVSFFLHTNRKPPDDHDDSEEDGNGQEKSDAAEIPVHGSGKDAPSSPPASIFFIEQEEGVGSGDQAPPQEEDQENGEPISEQELYHKAERFIGNFYMQLKMQKEESWNKKLHAHRG